MCKYPYTWKSTVQTHHRAPPPPEHTAALMCHTHSYTIISFSHYVQCQQELTTACDSPVVSAPTPGYVPPSVRFFPALKIASVELLVDTWHLDAMQSQVTILASRCFLLSLKNVLTHPSALKNTLFHFRLFGGPGTFSLSSYESKKIIIEPSNSNAGALKSVKSVLKKQPRELVRQLTENSLPYISIVSSLASICHFPTRNVSVCGLKFQTVAIVNRISKQVISSALTIFHRFFAF